MKRSKLILTVTTSVLAVAALAATKARTNRLVCTKHSGTPVRGQDKVCTVPGGTGAGTAKCFIGTHTAFSNTACATTLVTASGN